MIAARPALSDLRAARDSFRSTWPRWVALAGLAFGLRLAAVFLLHTEHAAPVSFEHGEIAGNLLAGRGFSVRFLGCEGPTSQQAPLYPLMLAGLFSVFGVESPAALVAMQLLQCVAGTLLVLCVVKLTQSVLPDRPWVAWTAGFGAALFPTHVYAVTHLQVCLWVALLLTWLVVASVTHSGNAKAHVTVGVGLLSGFLLLFEPIMAIPVGVIGAWSLLFQADKPVGGGSSRLPAFGLLQRLRWLGVFAGICALVVTPWIYRNWRVHDEFVFVKSTFGYALWQGNNPSSWGTDKVPKPTVEAIRRGHDGSLAAMNRALWEARHETIYIDDLLLKPNGYAGLAGLSEVERSRELGRRATAFIAAHPASYAKLCIRRLRYFLLWDETNPKAAHPLYRVTSAAWLLLTGLGLVVWPRRDRRLGLLLAVCLGVTLFHTLTITSARFRVPIEPLTFSWTAYGLVFIAGRFAAVARNVLPRLRIATASQPA